MDARAITKALGGKWQGRYGLCRCPVHADRTPSLKVSDDARRADGIDLICFAGCDWKDIKDTLQRQGLLPEFQAANLPLEHQSANLRTTPTIDQSANLRFDTDTEQRVELALKIWKASKPLPGTLGWKYLTERRGLHVGVLGELSHALRWHEGFSAVVALMTNPQSNEPRGVHRTFLNTDGTKRERKMLGRQGVVRLSPDEDVTQGLGIAEGIETALGVLTTGWEPMWAATNSGAIERFPPLAGIEALTIFADVDAPGMVAAEACARNWCGAGREVRIAHPKDVGDALSI